MKTIEKKRKKFLKTLTHIVKTEFVSAHIIAGKLIFEKVVLRNRKKAVQYDYIEKFMLERGDSDKNHDFLTKKIDEIKTPQIKKKVNHILKSLNLTKSTSLDLEVEQGSKLKTLRQNRKGRQF